MSFPSLVKLTVFAKAKCEMFLPKQSVKILDESRKFAYYGLAFMD